MEDCWTAWLPLLACMAVSHSCCLLMAEAGQWAQYLQRREVPSHCMASATLVTMPHWTSCYEDCFCCAACWVQLDKEVGKRFGWDKEPKLNFDPEKVNIITQVKKEAIWMFQLLLLLF